MKLFFNGGSKHVSKSADGLEGILCTEELSTTHMSKDYAKVVSNFASEVEAGESKMNEKSLNSSYQANYKGKSPRYHPHPQQNRSKPGINASSHPPITIQRVSFSPSRIAWLVLLRSSDHGRRRNVASRGGAGLAGNDFLLNLDQGAAGAAGGEQDIGDEIALDVVGLTGFETLEELEAGRWN
jgi:hypothetical protein